MGVALFLVGFCVVLGVLYYLFMRAQRATLPPGPPGIPYLGNVASLTSDPPKQFAKWSETYGDTITVELGLQRAVIIHDYDKAKHILSDENTTGRDQKFIFNRIFEGHGLVTSEGELWRDHRRFALASLRDLGMGKTWFEDQILQEVSQLIGFFESHNGKAFYPRLHMTHAVSNVICALVLGKRFDHSDKNFLRLCNLFSENLRMLTVITPVQWFPFLRFIPFSKIQELWKAFFLNIRDLKQFIGYFVNEHLTQVEKPTDDGEPERKEDYIASYAKEMEKQKRLGNSSSFTEKQLLLSVLNLFAAGTETTTSTLLWVLLYMIENPDVQRKIHEEIDSVIGREREIRMADKHLLKYLDAATLEASRLGSIVPLSVMHTNFEKMKIDGWELPPRTRITINSYAMHRNPKYWKHPDKFYPEHFLDKDGSVHIPKGFAAFGIGKRACIGESLAKMEVYLFFANIMQKFRIERAEQRPGSSEDYHVSFVRALTPYDIRFVSRE